MQFTEWLNQYFPTFQDKLSACASEIVSAAQYVDIDASNTAMALGLNKGSRVAVLSAESKGRCRIYVNEKEYAGHKFPHLVFLNLRNSFSDSLTGKAIPSVVDGVSVLYERYRSNNHKVAEPIAIKPKQEIADQTLLINEQRNWFQKLKPYSLAMRNAYFTRKGLSAKRIVDDLDNLNFRNGYSPRYGGYTAIPLRRFYSDTFSGFQRIYENGSKIMIRDFNPNGLCSYFGTDEKAYNLETINAVIFHEGQANALLAHFMCKDMKLEGVVNLACLYADNIPLVAGDVAVHLPELKRQLCLHDNDANGKGQRCAEAAKEKNGNLAIDCLEVNDLAALVEGIGYKKALKQFSQLVLKAFR